MIGKGPAVSNSTSDQFSPFIDHTRVRTDYAPKSSPENVAKHFITLR